MTTLMQTSTNQTERETIRVCAACGKTELSPSWDEACEMNAVMCYRDRLVCHPDDRHHVLYVADGGRVTNGSTTNGVLQ